MKTVKTLITLVVILIATFVIAKEKRTISKDEIQMVNQHAIKLKEQGVSLEQIQAKYESASSDGCIDRAWEFGSQFEGEYMQWLATDAYMRLHCMGGGGPDTDGEEDY